MIPRVGITKHGQNEMKYQGIAQKADLPSALKSNMRIIKDRNLDITSHHEQGQGHYSISIASHFPSIYLPMQGRKQRKVVIIKVQFPAIH